MERKVSLFMEGLGGLDCSFSDLSHVSQDRHLSCRWGLHLPMEDCHFSVNGGETGASQRLFCLSWVVWEMVQLLATPLGLLILCFALWLNQGGLWGT